MTTLPGTNSKFAPEKMAGPKGNDRLPTIDFQGRTVSFREGSFFQGFSDGNSSIQNSSWENQMKVIHSQFASENSIPSEFVGKICVCVCLSNSCWQPSFVAGQFGSLTPPLRQRNLVTNARTPRLRATGRHEHNPPIPWCAAVTGSVRTCVKQG